MQFYRNITTTKIKDYKVTTTNRNKLYSIECYHIYYDCNYGWWCILSQIMLTHCNSTTSIVEVAKLQQQIQLQLWIQFWWQLQLEVWWHPVLA